MTRGRSRVAGRSRPAKPRPCESRLRNSGRRVGDQVDRAKRAARPHATLVLARQQEDAHRGRGEQIADELEAS